MKNWFKLVMFHSTEKGEKRERLKPISLKQERKFLSRRNIIFLINAAYRWESVSRKVNNIIVYVYKEK